MSMVSMCVGATTDTRARFVAKVDTGPVRIAYDTDPAMGSPAFSSSVAVDAQGVAKVEITGLTAGKRYHWQVEDNGTLDTSTTGQLITHPVAPGNPASFTIALAGDAGQAPSFPGSGTELSPNRISNHPVFDTIRTRAVAGDWLAFLHLGDLHYYDFGQSRTDSLANRRKSYDDILAQSRQHQLYREVPWWYVWDDHDFGPNNSDGTYVDKAVPQQVYRERMPHYNLPDLESVNQAPPPIGRVLVVMWDCRSYRSPNSDPDTSSKTMLGSAQLTWMDSLLAATAAEFLVVVSPSQWLGTVPGGDGWRSFEAERTDVLDIFGSHGFLDRMCIVGADAHYIAMDSGTNENGGGIPTLHFAPLDASGGAFFTGRYDLGPTLPGRHQYGTLAIRDDGGTIAVTGTGYRGTRPLRWHTVTAGGKTRIGAGNPSHVIAL